MLPVTGSAIIITGSSRGICCKSALRSEVVAGVAGAAYCLRFAAGLHSSKAALHGRYS